MAVYFPLGYAVVPVSLDTADEAFEDFAELDVGLDSLGYVLVELRSLILSERLVVLIVGQRDELLAKGLLAALKIEEFPAHPIESFDKSAPLRLLVEQGHLEGLNAILIDQIINKAHNFLLPLNVEPRIFEHFINPPETGMVASFLLASCDNYGHRVVEGLFGGCIHEVHVEHPDEFTEGVDDAIT